MFYPFSSGQEDIVKDGLVLWLDAGDRTSYPGGGNVWRDLTSNANNGTLFNTPTFSLSNGGNFSFDGSDDYAFFSNAITDLMNTVNIWINMASAGPGPIIQYGQDLFDSNFWTWGMAIFPSSTHGFSETNLNYPTSALYTEGVNINQWKNFTLVRNDNGNTRLYKNGQLVGTKIGSGTTAVRNVSDRLYIAKGGSSYGGFNLSQLQIYNRALSANEVSQNFNATRARFGV